MLALALRQAVRQQPMKPWPSKLQHPALGRRRRARAPCRTPGPLYIATPTPPGWTTSPPRPCAPRRTTSRAWASPWPHALDRRRPRGWPGGDAHAWRVTSPRALVGAERPLVVAGRAGQRGDHARGRRRGLGAGAAGKRARLCFVVPECNSLGLALLGGGALEAARQAVREGAADTVDRAGERPLSARRAAAVDASWAPPARDRPRLTGQRHGRQGRAGAARRRPSPSRTAPSSTTRAAPSASSRSSCPQGDSPGELALAATLRPQARAWDNLDDVIAALAAELPVFARRAGGGAARDFRIAGQKIPANRTATAAAPPCSPTSASTNPSRRDDPDSPLSLLHGGLPSSRRRRWCRSSGRPAGTPCRR